MPFSRGHNFFLNNAWPVVLVILVTIGFTLADGPSLPDLLKIQCPPEKPFKCLPYGSCCSGDQFCHEGSCESCFPSNISDKSLFTWCRDVGQYESRQMRHASCRAACHFKFNATDLAQYEDLSTFSNCTDEKPKKCSAGHCCGDDQYCSGQDCLSCFPSGLSRFQLASWCREKVNSNSSFSGDHSCKFACYAVFTPEQLSKIVDSVDHWMIAFFVVCGFLCVCLVADVTCPYWRNNLLKRMRSNLNKKIEKGDIEFIPVSTGPSFNVKLERNLSMEEKKQENI